MRIVGVTCAARADGRVAYRAWKANLKIYVREPRASTLSVVGALTYSASKRDDALDLLFLGQVGRIDQDGVGRLHRLRGVTRIAVNESLGLLGDLIVTWASVERLQQTAAGAFPGLGSLGGTAAVGAAARAPASPPHGGSGQSERSERRPVPTHRNGAKWG